MAVNSFGSTSTNPRQPSDFVGASATGTLDGGQYVQLNWDTTVFDSSAEGKERLINAIEMLYHRIQAAKIWPVTSAS